MGEANDQVKFVSVMSVNATPWPGVGFSPLVIGVILFRWYRKSPLKVD